MADEKTIVLKIETITDQAVMEAYGKTLNSVLGSYEENIALITQYNAQMKANNEQMKAIQTETERWGKTTQKQAQAMALLTAENNKLKQAKAELVQITKNQEKIDTSVAGTMENQSQILGKLREAWRLMTDEQKAANQGMLETIQQLDAGLKNSDAEIGNFQRNVGNYAGAIAQALARLDILPPQIATYISAIGRLQAAYKTLSTVMGTGAVASVKAFITSLSGVKKAMLATGVGALVVTIGMLIAHWDDLKNLISNTSPEEKARRALAEYNTEISKLAAQTAAEKIVKVRELAHAYAEIGDNAEAKRKFVETYKSALADVGIEVNNVIDADRVLIADTGAYVNAIMARAKADAIRAKASKDYEKTLEELADIDENMEFYKENLRELDEPFNYSLYEQAGWEHYKLGERASPFAQMYLNRLKESSAEYTRIVKEADAAMEDAFKQAAKLDEVANAKLAPRKTGSSGGKTGSRGSGGSGRGSSGGKSDAQRQAEEAAKQRQRELEAIAKYNVEAGLSLMDEGQRELAILENTYKQKLALYIKYGEDTTLLTAQYEKERADIIQKYTDKDMAVIMGEIDDMAKELDEEFGKIELIQVAKSPLARALRITDEELASLKDQALQAASQIFNSIQKLANEATQRRLKDELEAIEKEAESEKAILESKVESGILSQKEYEKKLAELDEQTAERKEQANKEAFEKQKRWNIAQALMNAALAITKLFTEGSAMNPATWVAFSITAATTAAEIATIAAQKYARGGELRGPSHAQGGIKGFVGNRHIEAEGGEVIINKRSSAKHRKLLSLINSDNGWGDDFAHARGSSGRFFARGGVIGGYDFRTAPLPEASSTLAQFARRQADNLQASFEAINRRIDNLRVSVLLSDIEAKSNEKRVHVSRAVL